MPVHRRYNGRVSRATVVIELGADAGFARDLEAGGVFVPGCALRLSQECDLLVCGANHRLVLPARVVYVDAQRGAGLELVGFSSDMKARLAALEPMHRRSAGTLEAPVVVEFTPDDGLSDAQADAQASAEVAAMMADDGDAPGFPEPIALDVLEALEDDLALSLLDPETPETREMRATREMLEARDARDARDTDPFPQAGETDDANPFGPSADTEAFRHEGDARDTVRGLESMYPAESFGGETVKGPYPVDSFAGETVKGPVPTDDALDSRPRRDTRDPDKPFARNVHERLRGLTLTAQVKLAVHGELHERIVLERLYGKNVWEALLRNPRLTAPEVSRIARYGSLPRVLLEIIVGNNTWLQIPEVRRALLSNPRLGTDQVIKVLRLTPKHELKLATVQTAYPVTVRNAAKLMLRE